MQDGYSIGRRRDFIMPTLPQTSAQQYLIRARAEARWNHRRAGVPFGPTLPVNKFTPDDQSAWALEEARRSEANVSPTELPNEPLWSTGSVLYEAREFVAMLGRNGNTVEDLRACIGISDAELKVLNEWAEAEPRIATHIQKMVRFRRAVLGEFDCLLEIAHRAHSTGDLPAQPNSSTPATIASPVPPAKDGHTNLTASQTAAD